MIQENIDELIALKLSGEIDEEGDKKLSAWIASSEENRNHFVEMQNIWDAGYEDHNFNPDVEMAWSKVSEKLTSEQKGATIRTIPTRRNALIYRVAASIVVLLGITWFFTSKFSEPTMIQYATLENEQKEIILPDQSKVFLNANTTLEFPEKFKGDNREIKLEGEAFFEITKDPNRPFIIHTDRAYTKVLGTSFNVLARKNSAQIVVSVKTGKVEVGFDNNNNVKLEAGYTAKVNLRNSVVEKIETPTENYLSWKTKEMKFEDVTISELITFLEEYYSVEINANDEILDCHFTGKFSDVSLTDLLNVLELSNGIKFEIHDDVIILQGNPCVN